MHNLQKRVKHFYGFFRHGEPSKHFWRGQRILMTSGRGYLSQFIARLMVYGQILVTTSGLSTNSQLVFLT